MTRRHHHSRVQRWGMLFLFISCVAYFILITMSSARGSQLRKLSQKQHALQRETQDIDLDIAAESSVQKLKKRVEALGLQPMRRVEYASSPQPHVANK